MMKPIASMKISHNFHGKTDYVLAVPPISTYANPTVSTTSGDVTGTTNELAHAFYEIPYAEPPIGNLRSVIHISIPEAICSRHVVIFKTFPSQIIERTGLNTKKNRLVAMS